MTGGRRYQGLGEDEKEGEAVLDSLGCQPGGQRGFQRADAMVGQVDVGDI